MELNWLYRRLGEDFGPVSLETLHELLADGQLDADDLIRHVRDGAWRSVSTLPPLDFGQDGLHRDSAFDLDVDAMLAAAHAAGSRDRSTDHTALGRRNFAPAVRTTPLAVTPATPAPNWYCQSLGQVLGPYTFEALKEMAAEGALSPSDDVREGAEGTWLSARRLPELFPKQPATGRSSAEMEAVNLDRPEWFRRIHGEERGPVSLNDLQKLIEAGGLDRKDVVRRTGGAAWIHAQDCAGLTFPKNRVVEPLPEPAPAVVPRRADSSREMDAIPAERPPVRPAIPVSTVSSYAQAVQPAYSSPPPPAYRPSAPPVPPPPPRPAKSSSGPSWSFSLPSGWGDQLKNPKLFAGIGGCMFAIAILFVPKLLMGSAGVREYAVIQQLWDEVDKAVQSNAPDTAYSAMKTQHLEEVKALKAKIEPRASAQNRLAQIILYCTRDHLPKLYEGSGDRKKIHARMKADMQEASELYQRHAG